VARHSETYGRLSDHELLDRYTSDRNTVWLGILLERYTMMLLGVCMKYLRQPEEARDAVQQVFAKVIVEIPRQSIVHFKSWLYRVTVNHCLVELRKKPRHVGNTETLELRAEEEPDLDALWEKEIRMERLREEIGRLSPEQKRCITLFYLDRKSYREIAELTGFSLLQVKSFIQNGKRNLKNQLSGPGTT
jgi:RNA polymerase sigma-70 factor (ECF subfamily)